MALQWAINEYYKKNEKKEEGVFSGQEISLRKSTNYNNNGSTTYTNIK